MSKVKEGMWFKDMKTEEKGGKMSEGRKVVFRQKCYLSCPALTWSKRGADITSTPPLYMPLNREGRL